MKQKSKPEERRQTITRALPCTLTGDELRDRALTLAKVTQDIATAEDRIASVRAQLKSELQALQANQAKLAGIVARGEEIRDVMVLCIYDYTSVSVRELRVDNGQLLSERAMTEAEAQMPLPVE